MEQAIPDGPATLLPHLHRGAVVAGAPQLDTQPPVLPGRQQRLRQRVQAGCGVAGEIQQGGAACRHSQGGAGMSKPQNVLGKGEAARCSCLFPHGLPCTASGPISACSCWQAGARQAAGG